MSSIIRCRDLQEIPVVAAQVLKSYSQQKVFLISGKMGVGKTTFIKEICKQLHVVDNVSSPTFSIVNEYRTETGNSIFHFDFYRIKNITELYDIGYEEYLYSDHICLIEWPELAMEIMPTAYVKINIEIEETTGERIFDLSLHTNEMQNL